MGQDNLGDRQKGLEMAEAGRKLMPLLPILIRLDGRGFSKLTVDLPRPFSVPFHQAMVETTKHLVDQTNARIGYTQSDEISLVLYADDYKSELFFGGRIQKMVSILAAAASVRFNQAIATLLPEKVKSSPLFDCRVWAVSNKVEAANAILWRVQDATKNSVSQAAHTMFSSKQLFGKHTGEQKQMMLEKDVDWTKYPEWFKNGQFVKRVLVEGEPDKALVEKLTRAGREIPQTITRHKLVEMEMPPFGRVINRVEVIFDDAKPLVGTE